MSWGCGGAGVMGREAALLRALMEGPGDERGGPDLLPTALQHHPAP